MSITVLAAAFRKRLDEQIARPVPFGQPEAMAKAVIHLRQTLRVGGEARPAKDRITEALRILYAHGVPAAMGSHGRYLCWGFLQGQPPLLDKTELAQELLASIRTQFDEGRLTATAWRGLLDAYFSVPSQREAPPAWTDLRALLAGTLGPVMARARYKADWLLLLDAHRDLLGDDPCGRYAAAMSTGDTTVLDPLKHVLRVPEGSWFWKELILAQVREACRQSDPEFVAQSNRLIPAVREHPLLIDDALIALLTRHAGTMAGQPNDQLKSLAVDQWGSPHLMAQARWNLVAPPVKQMVQEWITREDLRDFFAILQADGAADERRLNFWLRYARQIEYAQFALGQYAFESQKQDYVQLRAKRKDRIARLTDQPDALNNAFIIKIKDMLFVEFGQVGNACYIYRLERCPFNPTAKSFQLFKLKNRAACEKNFSHNHSWEVRLEYLLQEYGILPDRDEKAGAGRTAGRPWTKPAAPPSGASSGGTSGRSGGSVPPAGSPALGAARARELQLDAVREYAKKNGLMMMDNTRANGALWIMHNSEQGEIARVLRALGMKYKDGRGWWV